MSICPLYVHFFFTDLFWFLRIQMAPMPLYAFGRFPLPFSSTTMDFYKSAKPSEIETRWHGLSEPLSTDTSEAFDHSVLSDSPRGLWWQCRLSSSLVDSAGQWAVLFENDNGAWRLLVNAWWWRNLVSFIWNAIWAIGIHCILDTCYQIIICSLVWNRRFQALATGELVPSLKDLGSVLWKDRASKAAKSLTKMEQVWKRRRSKTPPNIVKTLDRSHEIFFWTKTNIVVFSEPDWSQELQVSLAIALILAAGRRAPRVPTVRLVSVLQFAMQQRKGWTQWCHHAHLVMGCRCCLADSDAGVSGNVRRCSKQWCVL